MANGRRNVSRGKTTRDNINRSQSFQELIRNLSALDISTPAERKSSKSIAVSGTDEQDTLSGLRKSLQDSLRVPSTPGERLNEAVRQTRIKRREKAQEAIINDLGVADEELATTQAKKLLGIPTDSEDDGGINTIDKLQEFLTGLGIPGAVRQAGVGLEFLSNILNETPDQEQPDAGSEVVDVPETGDTVDLQNRKILVINKRTGKPGLIPAVNLREALKSGNFELSEE